MRALVLVLLLLLPGTSARAGIGHVAYQLDNGLNVALYRDTTTPTVAVGLVVKVGWRDEEPGKRHLAHLVEHLMFQRSESAERDFATEIERLGGSYDASTHLEHTEYLSMIPSTQLHRVLWLEADRFGWLAGGLTDEDLDAQREVIRSEGRQRIRDSTFAPAMYVVPSTMYSEDHPYWLPADGAYADLDDLTLQDVAAFHARHYVPGNALLVVSGDFDEGDAKRWIAETFGSIEGRKAPARTFPEDADSTRSGRRRVTADVPRNVLVLTWPSAAYAAKGDAELDVFATLLDGISHEGLVWSVRQRSLQDGGEFSITVTYDRHVPTRQAETSVWNILEYFSENEIEADILQDTRRQLRRLVARRLDGPRAVAGRLMSAWRLRDRTDWLDEDWERFANVTPGDLRRTVRRTIFAWEPVVLDVRYEDDAPPPCIRGLELTGTKCAEVKGGGKKGRRR